MTPTGSTLPRRMLGRQLRELRNKSGVSVEVAREAIGVGKQTLWRMETGQPVRLNPLFIERLCKVYGASEDVTNMMLGLAEEAGRTGWWHAYGDAIPKHFDLFVGLEEAAKRIVSYQTTLLPGLLQTDEYRRAITWVDSPTMPTAEVERRIELFNRRKIRLTMTDNALTVEALVDEAMLHRAIGGPAVMADQLNCLAKVGELPNVSVRVIPLKAEAYAGLVVGPFVLLEFPGIQQRTSPSRRSSTYKATPVRCTLRSPRRFGSISTPTPICNVRHWMSSIAVPSSARSRRSTRHEHRAIRGRLVQEQA